PALGRAPGTLYLVSTPIGNLEDISLRALRVLRQVRLVAAEDARFTRKLLDHFAIPTQVLTYRLHSRCNQTEELLACLRAGQEIALVSDAGTPAIADPGSRLIAAAIAQGVPVVPIPGPVAPSAPWSSPACRPVASPSMAFRPAPAPTARPFSPPSPARRARSCSTKKPPACTPPWKTSSPPSAPTVPWLSHAT